MRKAREEFEKAVARAKSIRHNAVLVHVHSIAKDISSQSIYTWTLEAIMQLLEAIKLEVLTSGSHIMCSWAMGDMAAAKERFKSVFESVEILDVIKFASNDGVSSLEVAEVVCDMYWLAMRVAGLSTEHLQSLSIGKGWDVTVGETFFQITLSALRWAKVASNQLLKFDDSHSLDYVKERDIANDNSIHEEENKIRKWWEATKAQAQTTLPDVARHGCVSTTLPRSDVMGEMGGTASSGVVAPLITMIIIVQSDSRLLQDRHTSSCLLRKRIAQVIMGRYDRREIQFGILSRTRQSGHVVNLILQRESSNQ
jgi:hypothetical protein